MTNPAGQQRPPIVVLCIDSDPEVLDSLRRDIGRYSETRLRTVSARDRATAMTRAEEVGEQEAVVPLVFVGQTLSDADGADLLAALHRLPHLRGARKVLVCGGAPLDAMHRALQAGALNGSLAHPWSYEQFSDMMRMLLTEYFTANRPSFIDEVAPLLDISDLSHAFATSERERRDLNRQLRTVQRSFLSSTEIPDEQVEQAMIECLDRSLEKPPRTTVPAGAFLFRQGETLNGIWIVLQGKVQLSRVVDGQETVFHSRTVGRVLGLLSLSMGGSSYFDCRTQTDVTVIRLTLDQLDEALRKDPMLSVHFVTVLLRSLARRNWRAVELQLEINALNLTLGRERDQLARALREVQRAQMLLVEHEKMATLGQLAAGVAHELNNPVAAIRRASDFLVEDLRAIAATHPDGETLRSLFDMTLGATPLSTREQRERRKELAGAIGDEALARTLVEIGIHDRESCQRYFGGLEAARIRGRLDQLKRYSQLSGSVRNIRSCADRILGLVQSLRSYTRSGSELVPDVDLHVGIEDTLRLFSHELRGITVEREYGELPRIACNIGEINQVWTNLASNALQAMRGSGTLRIETRPLPPDRVQVDVIDSGGGISPQHLDKIFEVNFTTRQGRADFGLGIGLPICRDVIQRHNGSLSVESRPGRTCFRIVLPVDPTKGESTP